MNMNRNARSVRFFTLVLLGIVLMASSITANPKLLGQLTIESNSSTSFIKINGELKVSGSTVLPATEIITPGEASAKINFGKVGQTELAPNSKMNLNFSETTISNVLKSGRLTVAAAPNIAITIQTADGIITNPDKSKNSVIVVDFVNGKTRIRTRLGTAAFNGTAIPEGQTFSEGMLDSTSNHENSNSVSFVSAIFISLLGATHFGNLVLDTHTQTETYETQISNFDRPEFIISHHK